MDVVEVTLTRRKGDVAVTKSFSVDSDSIKNGFVETATFNLFATKLREIISVKLQPLATRDFIGQDEQALFGSNETIVFNGAPVEK